MIEALPVAHEISYRFGRSMDHLRTPTGDGGMQVASVSGFISTVFGATAAITMVEGRDPG